MKNEETGQSNTGDTENKGIFGGIGDAISGIFDKVGDMTKSDSDTSSSDTSSAQDASQGSASQSSESGSWPDQSGSGSAMGDNAAQGSIGSTGYGDTGYGDTGIADAGMGADASSTGGGEEEPFVGSGGVGSPEFYEALRKGHEAAGDEYASDLGDPNRSGGA